MGLMKRILEDRMNSRGFSRGQSWEGPFDVGIEDTGKTQRWERSRNTEEMDAFNERLKSWGDRVRSAMPGSISSEGIKGTRLSRSIRNTYYYEYGEIYRLGFSFRREGIFVHKGVGRGYVMNNGIVVKISKSQGFNRKPKPWFNPVIERFMPELEQIIHEYAESAIVNSTRIYIR
jgi:hypothetical protein